MPRRAVIVSIALVGILVVSLLAALAAGAPATARAPSVATIAPSQPTAASSSPDSPGPGGIGWAPAAAFVRPDVSGYTFILPTGEVLGPATGSITNVDGAYSLNADVSGAIVDEFANSSFSGAGYTITSSTALGFAFQVNTTENVSVSDLAVSGSPRGFELINSTDISVTESSASSAGAGFEIIDGTADYVSDDVADSTDYGFVANGSTSIRFVGDTADSDRVGYAGIYASVFDVGYDIGVDDDFGAGVYFGSDADFYYDNFNGSLDQGIEIEYASVAFADYDWSVGSTYGLYDLYSDYVYAEYSSFADALGMGAYVSYSSYTNLLDDNFSGAAVDGAYVNHGNYNQVSYDTASFAGFDGFFLGNQSDSQSWYDVGDHDGWNGLEIADSDYVTSAYSSFNDTRASDGNGSFVKTTTNGELWSDYLGGDDVGLYALVTADFEAYGVNASYDNSSFLLVEDQSPLLLHDTAYDVNLTAAEADFSSEYVVGYLNVTDATQGFMSAYSSNGDIYGANLRALGSIGITLVIDTDSTIEDNVITNTPTGIYLLATIGTYCYGDNVTGATSGGLDLIGTDDVSLLESNVSDSLYGFYMTGTSGTNVSGNWFYADTDDFEIYAAGTSASVVTWNNFIDDGGWILYYSGGTPNALAFDEGYPGGGNFWSNHTGPDEFSGPGQNLPGPDGIVDTPMNISLPGDYIDHYPLARALDLNNLTVEFVAEGLPSGAIWGVQFWNYPLFNTTDPTVDYFLGTAGWQNYSYTVHAPAGWNASVTAGTVHFVGSAVVVDITFTPINYTVAFTQSSLPTGTAWSVTFDGQTESTVGPRLTFEVPNGTSYPWRVAPPPGYVVAPTNGSVEVAGAPVDVPLTFRAVTYTVTFAQSGLAAGTSWTATLDGQPQTSTGTTIAFTVPNGTYDFSIGNVSGYSVTPRTGSQSVAGPGASITVVYTANASSSSALSGLDWLLIALVIVLAVAVVLLLIRGRSKAAPASGVANWTPPPGSTPPPAGGSPPPSVPPGVSSPPPAPDWKET